jgi:hypothetical protein
MRFIGAALRYIWWKITGAPWDGGQGIDIENDKKDKEDV